MDNPVGGAMHPLVYRFAPALLALALLATATLAAAIPNPLDGLIVCVWEGPNGECG